MSQREFYRGAEAAHSALRQARSGGSDTPTSLAAAVHAAAQPLLDTTAAAADRACARGCAHCCHFPVGVTFGEAQRLARAVAADHAHQARVLAACDEQRDRSWNELVGVPCPLLEAGECSAHDARPLPCRAMASTDAQRCAAALAGGEPPPIDGEAFWRGLGAADTLAQATQPTGTRELRAALLAVLGTDRDQAAAFSAARSAPGG